MKTYNRKYDINDLIEVIRGIFYEYLGIDNVGIYDKFDSDLSINSLTKNRIILAIEHVLNYTLSSEAKDKINSIHDVLLVYKSVFDDQNISQNEVDFTCNKYVF